MQITATYHFGYTIVSLYIGLHVVFVCSRPNQIHCYIYFLYNLLDLVGYVVVDYFWQFDG